MTTLNLPATLDIESLMRDLTVAALPNMDFNITQYQNAIYLGNVILTMCQYAKKDAVVEQLVATLLTSLVNQQENLDLFGAS